MKKIQSKLISRYALTLLFILLFAIYSLSQTVDKTIIKETKIDSKVVVRVNKYFIGNTHCNIYIKTWNKSELRVEYKVFAEAKSEEKINEFYEELENIIETKLKNINYGSIDISLPIRNMNVTNKKNVISFKSSSLKHHLKKYEKSVTIFIPKNNKLNVESRFCNLFIDDSNADINLKITSTKLLMGNCKDLTLNASFSKKMIVGNVENAKLELRSSEIEMSEIGNNLDLNASFSSFNNLKIRNMANLKLKSSKFETSDMKELILHGNFIRHFKINNVEKATVSLNSSEFEANSIKSLNINNVSFSTFRINSVEDLIVPKAKSSKFFITSVNTIKANNSSFSDFRINNLKNSFTSNAKSGSIQLNNVMAGFSKINIDGQFVDININFEEASEYKVSADLQFPNYSFKEINLQKNKKNHNQEEIKGIKGNNKNPNSELIFNCKSCSIKLN